MFNITCFEDDIFDTSICWNVQTNSINYFNPRMYCILTAGTTAQVELNILFFIYIKIVHLIVQIDRKYRYLNPPHVCLQKYGNPNSLIVK
ncbi:hypothetical protein QTP88_022981 [Uroleucon formosanum]